MPSADVEAQGESDEELWLPEDGLSLAQADLGEVEQALVGAALRQPSLSAGAMVLQFEERFAQHVGRAHAISVSSGTLGLLMLLRAHGIGPGAQVLCPSYSWHQISHAVALAGAEPIFGEIDYWSGCLDAARSQALITPATRALIVTHVNGHPADMAAWRALAQKHALPLIEDSSEALASRRDGRLVGSFGDAAVFDFSSPSLLCCGEGGMIVTDDEALAGELRLLRQRDPAQRRSVSVGSRVPLQAGISELVAALGAAQLVRLPQLLERRLQVEAWYREEMQSFEGIKPPYVAPGVDAVHWMLYLVHLGKRFTASACDQIVEDMASSGIETVRYCQPLHQQFFYQQRGAQRGQLPLTERIADRALALPFHAHVTAQQVKFVVKTLKDSSTNVGAGAAIY
ncbi:MAG: DegT/DnrJ/EryC1/StrS family aminotransferase [Rubrivivax sp.]|nr:DegT/DnrJ/EryC1/StrS family aminotransferase [Rubrivivax sp.]